MRGIKGKIKLLEFKFKSNLKKYQHVYDALSSIADKVVTILTPLFVPICFIQFFLFREDIPINIFHYWFMSTAFSCIVALISQFILNVILYDKLEKERERKYEKHSRRN